jgi:CDP-glucose 4,6-dehydratase
VNALAELDAAFRGRTVLVTGHTGFKGAWLCEWLLMMGARVVGMALPPHTRPSLFCQLGLRDRVEHHEADIREPAAVLETVRQCEPDFVFHLAAQALVLPSYEEPVATFDVNVMGTVHLLEALRHLERQYRSARKGHCAAVLVTTDKCYGERGVGYSCREEDRLGGRDPYSASKPCAELGIHCYRQSFLAPDRPGGPPRVGLASARAGNVIGGGDWARNRIIPDCVRALRVGEPIVVRNPAATRPWQHVLEALGGYLILATRLGGAVVRGDAPAMERLGSAFNFGPAHASVHPVAELVREVVKSWPGRWSAQPTAGTPREAADLHLAWEKAHRLLGWAPLWSFPEATGRTVRWYRQQLEEGCDAGALTRSDIQAYIARATGAE